VEEVLAYAHANARALKAATEAADAASLVGQTLSIRSAVARAAEPVEILMGAVDEEVNPYSGRIMHRRRDVRIPEKMWDETTFTSTDRERVPMAYYIPAAEKAVLERLRAHGIRLEPVTQPNTGGLETFTIASTSVAPQPFENHQERTVTGTWAASDATVEAGAFRVPMQQPLARLAFYLLEPRSNDSLVTWNVLEDAVKAGRLPIMRTRQ